MALIEKTKIDKIEILETGHLQVREVTVIEKDGNEVARSYHRYVRSPLCDCSNDDPQVQAIASVVHTEEKKTEEIARRTAKQGS